MGKENLIHMYLLKEKLFCINKRGRVDFDISIALKIPKSIDSYAGQKSISKNRKSI